MCLMETITLSSLALSPSSQSPSSQSRQGSPESQQPGAQPKPTSPVQSAAMPVVPCRWIPAKSKPREIDSQQDQDMGHGVF